MLSALTERIISWASASRFRRAFVRYLATVMVMTLAITLATFSPLRESAWIIVIVAVVACSWFGGVGPSLAAPLMLIMSVRISQKESGHIFDFSSKELTDLGVLLLLTTAIGRSGQVRRRAQRLARRQALQLRDEAGRKDRFLATLAHELRNPLAPLRTALETLQFAGDHSADRTLVRELREIMQRQVDHLVRLIDDLLDVSRINTGKIELRRERVRLGDVIRDAVDSTQPHMDAGGHEFDVTIQDSELVFCGDRARVAQVLLNLLNNAAKFTPPGGRIQLSVARDGDNLEMRVRDNGIGIPPAMLPKIFEMFTQLDDARARSRGGLGIGLNLVRTLVEMHGGTVTATSDGPDCGSEFVVRLPLSLEEIADQREFQPSGTFQHETARRRRVLVVDDNKDAAHTLARLLTLKGHQCSAACCGIDALNAATTFSPEAVVLDIGMPGMNGYEVVQRLRGMPQGTRLVLIAVTGWGQENDRRRSLEAGFDHHLVKPVDIDALHQLLTASDGPAIGGLSAADIPKGTFEGRSTPAVM